MGRFKSKGVVRDWASLQQQEHVVARQHPTGCVPNEHDNANHTPTEATLTFGCEPSAILRDVPETQLVPV